MDTVIVMRQQLAADADGHKQCQLPSSRAYADVMVHVSMLHPNNANKLFHCILTSWPLPKHELQNDQ